MKKTTKTTQTTDKQCPLCQKPVLAVAGAFVLGCAVAALIAHCCCKPKVATVDVAQIIAQSTDIAKIQENQDKRMQELQKWIEEAQTEVSKVKSKDEKNQLAEKYEAELQQKKEEMQQQYSAELMAVDHKMTKLIKKRAKKRGYHLVLSKSSVLTGAKDLTKDVLEAIK